MVPTRPVVLAMAAALLLPLASGLLGMRQEQLPHFPRRPQQQRSTPIAMRTAWRRLRAAGNVQEPHPFESSPASSSLEPGAETVVLGVDYGVKRVGLACMAGWAPRPLAALRTVPSPLAAAKLVALAAGRELARVVVVGLPLDKDGTETGQALLTREFARLLASVLADDAAAAPGRRASLPVALVDERYSSKMAEITLSFKHARKRFDGELDSAAAGIILQDFFDGGGVHALDFSKGRQVAGARSARQRGAKEAARAAQNPARQRARAAGRAEEAARRRLGGGGDGDGVSDGVAGPRFEVVPPEPGLVAATEAAEKEAADLKAFEARRKEAGEALEAGLWAAQHANADLKRAIGKGHRRQKAPEKSRKNNRRAAADDFEEELAAGGSFSGMGDAGLAAFDFDLGALDLDAEVARRAAELDRFKGTWLPD